MAGLATTTSPRRHTQQVRLAGQGYRVADEDQAKAVGGRRWTSRPVDTQEVSREPEFHLPLDYFHEGGGYSFQGIPGTYDYADGWDASTPGKLSTWPKLTTGDTFSTADGRGWLLYVEPYLYVMRGRFVCKYRVSETTDSWSIIERHDLGSGNLVAGRPALFKGKGYVPFVDSSGVLQRFHQLTTVVTTVVESQTVAISGTPTSGTYTLTFDGKTTAAIAYNAVAADVQAALRLVAGLEAVTVSSSGTTPNFTHTVVMTGVGGSLAGTSPPQMTSTDSTSGGTHAIAHATTVAGTTDTWTLGPADRQARAFVAPWRDKLVWVNDTELRTVSADPMTASDYAPNTANGIVVGDSTARITDLCVYQQFVLVGKEDGMWSFDEDLRGVNELPDLQSVKDENNCVGMTVVGGVVHIPHRAGYVLWSPGSYRFTGPQQEGQLENAVTPWGRVSSIVPFGKYAFFAANDPRAQKAIIGSLQPPRGQRSPMVPHYHQVETGSDTIECVQVVSADYLPNPAVTPATWSDDSAVGTVTWGSPTNMTAADAVEASATAGTTHYLKGLNPNPVIPDTATPTGVKVRIKRRGGRATRRGVTGGTGTGVSIVVTRPADAQVGDYMVVAVRWGSTANLTTTGWTTIAGTVAGKVVGKFYESGDGASYTFTLSGATDYGWANYAAYGVHASNPLGTAGVLFASTSTSNATSHTTADHTPDATNALLLVVGMGQDGTGAPGSDGNGGAPTYSFDNSVTLRGSYGTGSAPHASVGIGDKTLSSGSATGATTVTTSTTQDALTSTQFTLNSAGDAVDNIVKLVKGGSVVGDNKADTTTVWPSTAGYAEYGGQNDLWGTTLTAAEVNANDFGIVLSATVTVGTVYADHAEVIIYYTVSGVAEPQSFLVALRVDGDRATVTPDVYKLPRADLAIGNDPAINRAITAGADFYTSRLFFPTRNIEKVWRCFEFWADMDPETNTPGLQIWVAVDDGTEFQLVDANESVATIRTSGFHRVFFPPTSASRGKWVQLHFKVPAVSGSENGVAVDLRGCALRGWFQPTNTEVVDTLLELAPGARGDYSGEKRTAMDQLADLEALTEPGVNPTPYRDIWGREGYCRVLEVAPRERVFQDGKESQLLAAVKLMTALYE